VESPPSAALAASSRSDPRYRAVVVQLLRSQAYRERGAARLFQQALPLVPARWRKLFAWHAEEELDHYRRVAAVWAVASGQLAAALDAWVDARLGERPLPGVTSFVELAMVEFLFDRAGAWQLREYVESSYLPYQQLAREILDDERGHQETGARLLIDLAADRAAAQAAFTRWLPVSLLSFGRPDSEGNRFAIAAGLKRRDSGAVMRDYIADIAPTADTAGLTFPAAEALGLALPAGFRWGR
jgi:hypothetical protein